MGGASRREDLLLHQRLIGKRIWAYDKHEDLRAVNASRAAQGFGSYSQGSALLLVHFSRNNHSRERNWWRGLGER